MSRDKGEVAAAIVVTKKPEDYGVIPHAFIYLLGHAEKSRYFRQLFAYFFYNFRCFKIILNNKSIAIGAIIVPIDIKPISEIKVSNPAIKYARSILFFKIDKRPP